MLNSPCQLSEKWGVLQNGLQLLKSQLVNLVYGKQSIEKRWDEFRDKIKGLGVASMSEILNKRFPDKYMLWNGKSKTGFKYLQIAKTPSYDGLVTGKKYAYLTHQALEMLAIAKSNNFDEIDNLLSLDYFIWQELQRSTDPSETEPEKEIAHTSKAEQVFVHNDIRDKIKEIGQWLGFNASVEIKVADGAKVDAVWTSQSATWVKFLMFLRCKPMAQLIV